MKTISTHAFKHTLRDIHKNTENRRFCFVIGAGASFNSGIPTGGQLAKKWFSEIREMLEGNNLKEWQTEQKINENDLAASYGNIYRKRFENDKTSGYEFLVQAMKTAKPSFGHIVLAQILSRSPGHCVLTTNFDSLVESSIYQFTNKTPLVCGHESLSGYARPSQTHPLVIKIHRDLLLAPKSDPDEINRLDAGWKEPLDHIFSTHIPVIIGYGGNDGSLMSYFEAMNKPSNFFWCGLDQTAISQRIKNLLQKHEGNFVEIKGFDQLMHELLWVFDEIKPIEEELRDITNERIQIATTQLAEITSEVSKSVIKEARATEFSALEYSNLADNELDLEKRKRIYLEALEKYPSTGWLWWKFTYFLQYVLKDFKDVERYYPIALELNKNESGLLGNYANFLHYNKEDFEKADEYYLKAAAADPNHTINNGNYAHFLHFAKKDYDKAEEYYLKIVDSDNALFLSSYAHFLKAVRRDYTKAAEYYLKCLEIEPNDPAWNLNYAQILLEQGQDSQAEKYVNTALQSSAIEGDALIELWFYRYAHFSALLEESENKIQELLEKGVRSLGWDFSGNIDRAIKGGHPNPKKLLELAVQITTKSKK